MGGEALRVLGMIVDGGGIGMRRGEGGICSATWGWGSMQTDFMNYLHPLSRDIRSAVTTGWQKENSYA
jgi:hypothetical protein